MVVKFTSEQRQEFHKRFNAGVSLTDIAKAFNTTKQSIARSLQLKHRFDRYETQHIIQLYGDGYSTLEIGRLFDVGAGAISSLLDANDIQKRASNDPTYRKYNPDLTFFDKIDTEIKAYILGFLYADGCNSKYRTSIKLSAIDKDILEKISRHIYPGIDPPLERENKNGRKYLGLGFNSIHYHDQLTKLGCVSRKSLILKWPNWLTDKELQRHFIRGIFDGDGHISIWKPNNPNCKSKISEAGITSTRKFCLALQTIIEKEVGIHTSLKDFHKKNSFAVIIGGNRKVLKFLNWLYADSHIHMNRKHKLYKQVQKLIDSINAKIMSGKQGYARRYLRF